MPVGALVFADRPSPEISGSPTGTRVELADASIAGRRRRRIGPTPGSYSGSIDPDFDRQVRLTRTPCMLETGSIRWRWCCAQLTDEARPLKQKAAPRKGGFWIVCRELVLKLRHGVQFILRGLIHRVIRIPTFTGAGCRGCRGGSCCAGGGSRGSVWSGISSRSIRRCGRC
jgi:hypothetical protein